MPEPPLQTLKRWEDAGAGWRLDHRTDTEVTVSLLSCLGERVDQVRSGDPELLAYVARRTSSEEPHPEESRRGDSNP